ncbi:MAG: 2-C-methyl-D-erythritol 2,4-cyclodiphosphate synthase, partial [Thiovulaceae bacterium]|nr:2-C-methyl-D-erythritol 2,4-cyclodiphosphate synthase [Sulfurimonadaceae bacterium]
EDELLYMQNHTSSTVVAGGESRQVSLKNALDMVETPFVIVSDIARACVSRSLLDLLIKHKNDADNIVPFLPVHDTTVYQNETIDRNNVKLIQTPQLSKTDALKKALLSNIEYTDESSAIVANGGSRFFVPGEPQAHKLTRIHDLVQMPCFVKPSKKTLVGQGFDVHAFEDNKTMVLGGITISDTPYGFKAHSDGDVAIHALIDALLGAAGMNDIGTLFPDNDEQYKNIDSKELLKTTIQRIKNVGFSINNVDLTIMAEQPKIAPHKRNIRFTLAEILGLEPFHVNVKATTTEKLGFIGRKEGVAVSAVATLTYFDWTL